MAADGAPAFGGQALALPRGPARLPADAVASEPVLDEERCKLQHAPFATEPVPADWPMAGFGIGLRLLARAG
jgi:hypothetical protein